MNENPHHYLYILSGILFKSPLLWRVMSALFCLAVSTGENDITSGSGEEDFEVLSYMGMAAILVI